MAASRTVRAPSRLDRDAFVPGKPPFLLDGGPDAISEVANVYEVGYRGQAAQRITYSITAYHADYDHLHTQEIAPSQTFLLFAGKMEGRTTGIEAWATLQASAAWRLSAGYLAERQRFSLKPGSNDASAVGFAGRDPANSWLLRSSLALSASLDFDLTVRGAAALSSPAVPRYTVTDLRLGWRPQRDLELSVGARNLGGSHGEFGAVATRAEIDRIVFVGMRWDFDAR
jgi:iron complex outermembrane receptor protein